MHHDGPGNEVAQALVLRVQQHGDHAEAIKSGKKINEPDQVAGKGLKGVDGPPGLFDDANSRPALSRRLALPQRFKDRVIPPVDAEDDERDNRAPPDGAVRAEDPAAEPEECQEEQNDVDQRFNQDIEKDRHKAAADAGQSEFQMDLLWSIDDKLVTGHDDLYLLAGKTSKSLAAAGASAGPGEEQRPALTHPAGVAGA